MRKKDNWPETANAVVAGIVTLIAVVVVLLCTACGQAGEPAVDSAGNSQPGVSVVQVMVDGRVVPCVLWVNSVNAVGGISCNWGGR